MSTIVVKSFFDPATWTVSHVISGGQGTDCAIIDPVLDYDIHSGRTQTHSAQLLVDYIHTEQLTCQWILETHAHADHLSSAQWLKEKLGGKVAIGAHITQVQTIFKTIFNLEADFATDGSQFDHLFQDGEHFMIGAIQATAHLVPGHTPADMAYQMDNHLFVGDTLFSPDVGSARCDFPGGNAHQLYESAQKILSLPDDTIIHLCHDYPPTGREAQTATTVAEQKQHNIHLHAGISEEEFVAMRQKRDAGLKVPNLIIPSVQINIRAGQLPPAEANGTHYLKVPINVLGKA